jgi:L-malate glycosyltransferase
VPSDYLVRVFADFGVKAEAVFNTVDSSRFQFRERRALEPVLLSNRNLEPHYNVACTLRAFATIQTQVAEVRLIVAGDGSERRYLRELASELQLNNVDFVGAIAPERMPPLYDGADIFVNASNIDNQPLSIIEAFASGLPVVTTGAGGIRDMVSDGVTGFIVSCDDHAALADRVLSLLGDDELASRVASRARDECKNYSWAAVRNQWLTIYRELAPANDALRCKPVQHAESSGRM